jgi:hypothetical protein
MLLLSLLVLLWLVGCLGSHRTACLLTVSWCGVGEAQGMGLPALLQLQTGLVLKPRLCFD